MKSTPQITTVADDAQGCRGCDRHLEAGDEVCRILTLEWNVTVAKRIVSDGRAPRAESVDVLKGELSRVERLPDGRTIRVLGHYVDEEHVAHVNPDEPGIAAVGLDCYILIDGHHRVARCVQLGRATFDVYFLTKKESDSVLLEECRRTLTSMRRRHSARRRWDRA